MARRKQFGPALPPAMKKARAAAKRAARSLTKLQKIEVQKLVRAPAETKYVAQFADVYGGGVAPVPATAFSCLNSIVSGGVNQTAWNLMPALSEGAAGNQRVGNRITNATIKSTWQFYLNPLITNYPTVDATVKVFIVRAKSIKAFSGITTIAAGSLLDAGNATSIDWTSTNANADKMLDMYPVNKQQFTVLKVHKFRLCKNGDIPTGAASPGNLNSAAPNLVSHQQKDFSHSINHKGALIYPDSNLVGSVLPTNFTYFAFVTVWDTNSAAVLPANYVLANCRTHMWFKDM